MEASSAIRARLRNLPVFGIGLPDLDPATAPNGPYPLLFEWLDQAISADVAQPHAMTLATVDAEGQPSARTLLLKDVTTEPGSDGLWFATLADSPKGLDLAQNPRVALLLYWREQGRQIRVSGAARRGTRSESEADFLARQSDARATAIAGTQSDALPEREERERELRAAQEIIERDPGFVPENWFAYRVQPETIEFWQARADREQLRLRYERDGSAWRRGLLRP